MCTLRDVVVFFAGAEFFHTLSHVMLSYYVTLPLDMKFIVLTPSLNHWAILINGVITVALIVWAMRLAKKV